MVCPECGSDRLRPSRPRGVIESVTRKITRSRYHECSVCGTRSRFRRNDPKDAEPGVDVAFWIVVGLLGVGFVALLRRVG